jgi:FkbM family methyltransferase
MSLISSQNFRKFLRKTPEQRRITARFFATLWLAKFPFAPHKVHFRVPPDDFVSFWWSHFPGTTDPDGGSIFAYWGEDLGDLRFLWRFLRPGMRFFDVGANEGVYSVIAALKLGETGRVAAFEPSPRERRRLRIHLRLNRLRLVDVVPCAVAAAEGEGTLTTVISGNTGRNSLLPPQTTDPTEPIRVETTTIDSYLTQKRVERVDIVKIDTEGAELQILEGAENLLRKMRPLIICEVLDQSTCPWGYPAREIITKLRHHGYEWFEILRDGSVRRHSTQSEYPDLKNYLAVPKEKQPGIDGFQARSEKTSRTTSGLK